MLGVIGQQVNRDWRVLDVGCRDGATCAWFVSRGCDDVTGIDIKNRVGDHVERGFKFVPAALEDYQSDQPFDVVVAMYVLPFVKGTWEGRLSHLARLTARGGLLLCNVFADDDGWAGRTDIATIRDEDFRALLRQQGWQIRYEGHERYEGPTYEGCVKPWSVFGVLAERAR
jgi:SAM-dependent methyltransferase